MKSRILLLTLLTLIIYSEAMSIDPLPCDEIASLTMRNCEDLEGLPFIIDFSLDGCTVKIFDADGNIVPNPIPATMQYVCEDLTIGYYCDGDSCFSPFYIDVEEGPNMSLRPFDHVSANNYNMGHVPGPRVVNYCPFDVIVTDAVDDVIEICNDIPRVTRTWTSTNKCGKSTVIRHTFDIISDPTCTIIGPARLPHGVPVTLKIQNNPNTFTPYNGYNWKVIAIGKGWDILTQKVDPSVAIITAGEGLAQVEVNLFDRFNCKKTCIKDFSSYRGRGRVTGDRYSEATAIQSNIINNNLRIKLLPNEIMTHMYISHISGQIITTVKGSIHGQFIDISIENIPSGIYIFSMITNEGIVSEKFVKM